MWFSKHSRRTLLRNGVRIAALSALSGAGQSTSASASIEDDKHVIGILEEEGEPAFAKEAIKTEMPSYWFQLSVSERAVPNWPSDEASYDYHHLIESRDPEEPFELSSSVLQKLLEQNHFVLSGVEDKVLFALRGCELNEFAGDSTGWVDKQVCRSVRPDHINLRCTFGVWDRNVDKLMLFRGSTVPVVDLIEKCTQKRLGCNMMPCGLHYYSVGPHRGAKQPGAFRQEEPLWVLRSKTDLSYDFTVGDDVWDDLDGALPFDNIHAAMLSYRAKPPYFSSAGCQVVAGAYDGDRVPIGGWAEFRRAAGLAHPPSVVGGGGETTDDGRRFAYVLLTGKEASISARANGSKVRRVRFGSVGDVIEELQIRLGLRKSRVDGRFGRHTLGALLSWQSSFGPSTGILTPPQAAMLGLKQSL